MNSKTVLIGVKVLVAVVSGVAIFLGMSYGGNNNRTDRAPSESNSKDNCSGNENSPSVGNTLVNSIRNSQNSCRNAAGFLSALGMVAEKGMILFGKMPDNYYDRGNYGYGNPGGNIRLRRRSPYIIEAVGDGDIYDDNYDNHYL